jgi:hypothetical protein
MMFQRAPPDVAGLGLITSMSPLTTSSQVSMPSGFPGRTMNTTTELVALPSYLPLFQSSATSPASTSRCMSGSIENDT